MLSQDTIEKLLGISIPVELDGRGMAAQLVITVFPFTKSDQSVSVLNFYETLLKTFTALNIKIIPYEDALQIVPWAKILKRFFRIVLNNTFFIVCNTFGIESNYYHIHPGALLNLIKRKRIRKGVSIIALGKSVTSKLPIDFTSSFTKNSVITILDCPEGINENTEFAQHFDMAMNVFSYHMTHIAILVDSKKWLVYNFNASHPIYPIESNIEKNVLEALIPKIAAPIKPPQLKDFIIEQDNFNPKEKPFTEIVVDFIKGGALFQKTGLYPTGKKVSDLPFRTGFYRWIGKIHLDHRSGMSYGFLARQMPTVCPDLIPVNLFSARKDLGNKEFFIINGQYHVAVVAEGSKFILPIPPVWVLTQRSGSDKTNVNPQRDLILLGLQNGKFYLRTPVGLKLNKDYKPSFDTKVILAHALGNVIIASILKLRNPKGSQFVSQLEKNGLAIAHWHGYFNSVHIPEGWTVHGRTNPHVACSTDQSAIFALKGKLDSFLKIINKGEYRGDIHIEPHHGTNITFDSIYSLANLLLSNPNVSKLGNKYLV